MSRLFLLLLALTSLPSFAQTYYWRAQSYAPSDSPTALESCQKFGALYGYTGIYVSDVQTSQAVCRNSNNLNFGTTFRFQSAATTTTTTTTTTKPCPGVGTSHFAGTETYSNVMNLNQCIDGCGYTASGGIKAGGKNIIFGPMIATGQTCSNGSGGYGAANDPGSRCSYRNAAGVCEAACRTGQEYKQVPTGAYACVTSSNSTPDAEPKDTTCPRGYLNISQDPANPNCAPTGDLGNVSNNGPANCPAGQHSTNNGPGGASYCVYDSPDAQKPSTTTEKSPETTTTNPDGSTTKTRTETWDNSDGSKSTKTITTTTDPNGKVTVNENTVTGKNKLGLDGVSDGGGDDKSNFCKQNPGLTICKNSTVEGTGSATKCTGDMIQCEILKRISSAFESSPTGASTLGNSLLSGSDPLASTLPKPSNGLSLSLPGSLNQTGFLGAACFPDKQISVGGFTIDIPFSQACNGLLAFRAIILVLAAFACLRILSSVIFK